jgi:hypothetical protein
MNTREQNQAIADEAHKVLDYTRGFGPRIPEAPAMFEIPASSAGTAHRPMMDDACFWDSENAIVRAQTLQNPVIMAQAIELLQRQVLELQLQLSIALETQGKILDMIGGLQHVNRTGKDRGTN